MQNDACAEFNGGKFVCDELKSEFKTCANLKVETSSSMRMFPVWKHLKNNICIFIFFNKVAGEFLTSGKHLYLLRTRRRES